MEWDYMKFANVRTMAEKHGWKRQFCIVFKNVTYSVFVRNLAQFAYNHANQKLETVRVFMNNGQ